MRGGWDTVIKFKCEKCGGEIAVKYLKPGEEALCRNCGVYVVVPGHEEIAKGAGHAFELRCDRCGAAVDAAGLKPGETPPCPACGAAATFPDYAEAEKERRLRRFVPCPACGSDELKIIVFWGLGVNVAWLLRCHMKAVPVKCKKCGARFEGLTGRSVDEELYYVGKFRSFHFALYVIIGLLLVVAIILKVTR